ncbi:MAG: hypothetical protein IJ400_00125 [Clostridia bacterium]|nr:hypothetical protein [Clostridia bacterium]
MKKNEKKAITLCKGCLCTNYCRSCVYLDTNTPLVHGGSKYKCVNHGTYHFGSDSACNDFRRG